MVTSLEIKGEVTLPVKVGSSRAGNFLLTLSHIEEHGFIWLRPLEVEAFLDAISWKRHENLIVFFTAFLSPWE